MDERRRRAYSEYAARIHYSGGNRREPLPKAGTASVHWRDCRNMPPKFPSRLESRRFSDARLASAALVLKDRQVDRDRCDPDLRLGPGPGFVGPARAAVDPERSTRKV